jgi:hypothetical protein
MKRPRKGSLADLASTGRPIVRHANIHDAAHLRVTMETAMTRYRLDPVFDRTPEGAVKGIIRYDIYLDGHFVGSRRKHAQCHDLLDELTRPTPELGRSTATIHEIRHWAKRREGGECAA